jgi:hypothetical protein
MLLAALALTGSVSVPDATAQWMWPWQGPTNIEELEGDYQTLATCALTQLTRRKAGKLRKIEGQGVVRIASEDGWELAFLDQGPGVTRMQVNSGRVSEHFLAIARACSA